MCANKPILYLDMDGVLVDFESAFSRISKHILRQFANNKDDIPGIFSLMEPMPGAIVAVDRLKERYDLYILSSSPWENPTALTDKMNWIKAHFGDGKDSLFYKKVIFSQAKHLNKGDILIDDRTRNGAGEFSGRFILFGSKDFPDWDAVLRELM